MWQYVDIEIWTQQKKKKQDIQMMSLFIVAEYANVKRFVFFIYKTIIRTMLMCNAEFSELYLILKLNEKNLIILIPFEAFSFKSVWQLMFEIHLKA